jgi:capsular exopolysaccharide synthesis family protein
MCGDAQMPTGYASILPQRCGIRSRAACNATSFEGEAQMSGQRLETTSTSERTSLDAPHTGLVQIPVMSQVARPDRRLLPAKDSQAPRAASIRTLSTRLQLRPAGLEQSGATAITSPGAGEGRTRLAAEIAISFAQLGRRTLLVDADLRRPQLHLLFNIRNGPGLSVGLERGVTPHLCVVGEIPDLYLLAAGSTARNPTDLLSQDSFKLMVNEWRRTFELVVIDTPPMTQYPDGQAIAAVAGRALIVSRANHTPLAGIEHMLRQLLVARSDVAGTVISHF